MQLAIIYSTNIIEKTLIRISTTYIS